MYKTMYNPFPNVKHRKSKEFHTKATYIFDILKTISKYRHNLLYK